MRSRGKDPVGDLGTTKLVIFCKLYYIDVLTKKSKQYLFQLVLQMADRYSEMEARTERTPGSASEVLRQGGVISFAFALSLENYPLHIHRIIQAWTTAVAAASLQFVFVVIF